MTEEEKGRFRQLKAEVSEQLQQGRSTYADRYRRALIETDKRIGDYVFGVIDHPDAHNLYEILGVRRFLQMLDKYDWKPKRVKRFSSSTRLCGLVASEGAHAIS